jgi:hypothetical protein
MTFRDAETGAQQWIDTSDPRVLAAYRVYWQSTDAARRSMFIKAKLDGIEIRLDQPYMKPLIDFFRLRERRW